MLGILENLCSEFVVVNLGASGDPDYKAPADVLKAMTLVELDGGAQPIQTSDRYHRKVRISEWVSGRGGTRTFFERNFWACCGLSPARDEVVAKYGLEPFYTVKATREVSTRPLPDVLRANGINQVDFLKTDLEGLDFEVIESMTEWLPSILAVQCELRFDPIYQDEPPFEEVVPVLRRAGFDLVGLRPEYWKPKHPDWGHFVDGNVAWGDFVFLRSPASVLALAERTQNARPLVKHLLLAALLGKMNQALALLHRCRTLMPADEVTELIQVMMEFIKVNPAAQGPMVLPSFPHLADPIANVR
jgi:FkbM family methyltransferase